MIDSKEKGKRYERWVCRWWQEVTGKEARRTAAVAPQLDAAGVDLIGTGRWVVQCKAVERSMDLHQVLERMPLNAGINLVMHKKSKRGTVVAMSLDDFAWVLSKLEEDDDTGPMLGIN